MAKPFSGPPPSVRDVLVCSPSPHVLLVTISRPKQLNAIGRDMHHQLDRLWKWYDAEASLRCAVVTGSGRAFCAGADLREWNDENASGGGGSSSSNGAAAAAAAAHGPGWADGGFGGLSNRRGKKPVIAAVNGLCLGGGMEMALNADMVIAAADAKFGLPEVARGVVPVQGALPRLMRTVGMQRASEMAMLGRTYGAAEMLRWGLVNRVAAKGETAVATALRWAAELASNSPDSIIVTREGLLGGWDAEDPKASTDRIQAGIYGKLEGGENMREGVLSFVEKRKPIWKDSRL